MKFEVIALRRADEDVRSIARWLAQHSPSGAIAWLDAYEQMLVRLATSADACSTAAEDAQFNLPLQQALFGTPRGQTYRAVFTIVGDQVRILRVRGPGQPPLQQDELI
jgi:plasmid stabilization system protein ParE